MKKLSKLTSIRFVFAIAAGLAASTISSQAQSASATISGVLVGSTYDYTITLLNTGTFNLNSFWYGWTISGNNLPSGPGQLPTNAGNSRSWGNTLSGNSIMWINSSGSALAPGQSGVFTFQSTATPIQMTTSPAGESVAYVNGIDFSQGAPGDSTVAFSPTLVAAPEPSTFGLLTAGLVGLWVASHRLRPASTMRPAPIRA
jgi:PEP-CTERM motif